MKKKTSKKKAPTKTAPKGKVYTFVLNFGYAESSRLAFVPFTSRNKFTNAKDALKDLAEFFKEHFIDRHGEKLKECCDEFKDEGMYAFCPRCGGSLAIDDGIDYEDYMVFVSEIGECDLDAYSANHVEHSEEARWVEGQLEGAENQRFVYTAEKVLAAAIGYEHRSDGSCSFEAICKKRTKSDGGSFSFW